MILSKSYFKIFLGLIFNNLKISENFYLKLSILLNFKILKFTIWIIQLTLKKLKKKLYKQYFKIQSFFRKIIKN